MNDTSLLDDIFSESPPSLPPVAPVLAIKTSAEPSGEDALADIFEVGEVYPYAHTVRWSTEEDKLLSELYGNHGRQEIADRLTKFLREKTGRPKLCRTEVAVSVRANRLGLSAWESTQDELRLADAAREYGINYVSLHRSIKDDKKYPTYRRGRHRVIARTVMEQWLHDFAEEVNERDILTKQAQAAGAVVSKAECQQLTRVSESHVTRLLKYGVIKGWKLPSGQVGRWLVNKKSIFSYIQAREEGRLREYLTDFPAYQAAQAEANKVVYQLRKKPDFGKPDPLTKGESKHFPGSFTLAQVASHTGLAVHAVMNDVLRGHLTFQRVRRGGRYRYALPPDVAQKYAEKVKDGRDNYRKKPRQLTNMNDAGFLSTKNLMDRWGVSQITLHRWRKDGCKGVRLPFRMWGKFCAFHPENVDAFEKHLKELGKL